MMVAWLTQQPCGRRKRLHAAGDHSTCRPGRGRRLRVASVDDMPGLVAAVQGEFPELDPMVRALALKLAQAAVRWRLFSALQLGLITD
jgi:hypothetical protein